MKRVPNFPQNISCRMLLNLIVANSLFIRKSKKSTEFYLRARIFSVGLFMDTKPNEEKNKSMTAIMKFVFVSGFVLVSTVVQSYIRVPNKKRQLLVLVFHLTDQISLLTSCTVKHMCWQLNIKRQRSRIIAIVLLIRLGTILRKI